jgi:hypothetical protein
MLSVVLALRLLQPAHARVGFRSRRPPRSLDTLAGSPFPSRNGTILYRDADHLSVEGSLTLSDRFYRALEALLR